MTVDLTASSDARQPLSLCDSNEPIHWLTPRGVAQKGDRSPLLRSLLRFTSSLGLSACLTVATASAAIAPAAAAGQDALSLPEPQLEPQPAAQIDLSDAPVTGTIRVASLDPAPAALSAMADPLEAIVPVEPADTDNVRARIITSLPLTPAPESVRDEGSQVLAKANEHMTFDTMRVPRWIVDTILRASEATGVDPVYMMALADKESSFLPENRASTSSAEGLFQFVTSTWLEVVRSFGAKYGFRAEAEAIQSVDGQLSVAEGPMREHILGLRRNPFVSALMAAEMLKRDRTKIEARLGRTITRSEFYLAHFFGVDSAGKFIALLDNKPKQSASRVFPAAAKANRTLFFAKAGRKTRQLSVAEVYGKIDGMIDKRLSRYEDVSTVAVSDANL
ncbi:transglycosylase SLT domain-containing protein [Microvirga puerhi]|uniref:Transglycosylase SLT domain-containing protein n=1 Tax=Microvirga puerhi TaxID=2876078 RepID=A0ABS7VNZ3_9HYPH|nr:transglycosylase SLT domain-containing protein [Microvirga puerhi]MBZ6077261.1 transglycosylase SLT domain-containing protein [Microvirga puerhi]